MIEEVWMWDQKIGNCDKAPDHKHSFKELGVVRGYPFIVEIFLIHRCTYCGTCVKEKLPFFESRDYYG